MLRNKLTSNVKVLVLSVLLGIAALTGATGCGECGLKRCPEQQASAIARCSETECIIKQ